MIETENPLYRVEHTAAALSKLDADCERGYVQLGWLLLEVASMQLWKVRYSSFGDYLKIVAARARRTPGQLRQYFLTVRDLHDSFTFNQLEQIGISKAIRLRQAKDYALVLPLTVVTAALDPKISVRELKKIISIELKMPEEDGDWMDLEFEFVVNPEQRETLEQAISVAMHTEPLTKATISRSAQMLDVAMKFAQEFLGSHCGDGL
jgi:hypothetical protein